MAAATTRKRKQTDDMLATSPPKRITRARAVKTVEEPEKPTKRLKTTKAVKATTITTASVRVAATAKAAPAKPTRTTTKRKTPAAEPELEQQATNDEADPEIEVVEEASKDIVAPPRTRGRPKKMTENTTEAPAPKTRTRTTKVAAGKEAAIAEPKPKATRKKTAETVKHAFVEKEAEPVKSTQVQKTTRARAATSSKDEAAAPKKAGTRKKVTFEEVLEEDKENAPVPVDTKKKQPPKAAGIRAKPVRKLTTTRATRGRKPTATTTNEDEGSEDVSKPLSPKKVTQVAKSTSSGSEDELCEKSPLKALRKSPMKAPMSITKSPVKSLPGTCLDSQSSPTPTPFSKNINVSIIASPAKRPPHSPFKDAFKDTPKRANIVGLIAQPSLASTMGSPFKDTLKESPKRVNIATFSQSHPQLAASSQKSFKSSLLASPARRPASPFKSGIFASPSKSNQVASTLDVTTNSENTMFNHPSRTPPKFITSPLRSAKTPEQSMKVHTMTPAEQTILRAREESPSPVRESARKVFSEDELEMVTTPSVDPKDLLLASVPPKSPQFRDSTLESESEDELQSGELTLMSPMRERKIALYNFATETPLMTAPKAFLDDFPTRNPLASNAGQLSITPLALQMSSWCVTSPHKDAAQTPVPATNSVCSPAGATLLKAPRSNAGPSRNISPARPSHFEDQMFGHDDQPMQILEDEDLHDIEDPMEIDGIELAQGLSTDSSQEFEYGDENADPSTPLVDLPLQSDSVVERVSEPQTDESHQIDYEDDNANPTETVVQAFTQESVSVEGEDHSVLETFPKENIVTPMRAYQPRSREIHTVSKVPLRPSADDEDSLMVSRKRSKSVSAPLAQDDGDQLPVFSRAPIATLDDVVEDLLAVERTTPIRKVSYESQAINELMTPANGPFSQLSSPMKSVRKGIDADILRGAVVYVDVHTTEGADASGIFTELLSQMGARCVKQWSWNPRASVSAESQQNGATPSGKVGITHVIYKDGGKRTLQKVREARGLVLCVGVGWVLDCERENTWLEEGPYAIDTSTIPRGGHNRRKSMEPTRYSNVNGNLVPVETPAKNDASSRITVESPDNEFLSFSASSRRESIRVIKPSEPKAPATPTPNVTNFDDDDGNNWGSPTTPYYLSKGAQLIQQTCPPKQTGELLFPASGRIEDQPDEVVRQRLILARRKSLQWAPKVGSPLGRKGF